MLTGCRRTWELLRGGCCLEEGRDGLNSACGCAQHLGSGTDVGALRSRAVPPASRRQRGRAGVSSWQDSGCFTTYSREARWNKKKKKFSPANSTVPARGAAGGGETACSSQGLCTVHGGKTQPAMALGQHSCSPASPQQQSTVTGTHGTHQAEQSPATLKVLGVALPDCFTQGKRGTKTLFVGQFVASLLSCPSDPLSKLKLFLAAL